MPTAGAVATSTGAPTQPPPTTTEQPPPPTPPPTTPPPTTPPPPPTTTAAPPKPLNKVERVPGNEALGNVTVLYKFTAVPSRTEETVLSPIPNMQLTITIPPYTWLESRRRVVRPLTITVFLLPDGLAGPAPACGAAVDLGPHDQRLNGSIVVSLPCNATNYSRPYRLNGTDGQWTEDEVASDQPPTDGAVWARLRSLGTQVALETLAPKPPSAAGGGGGGSSTTGAAVGAALGSFVLVSLVGAGVWHLSSRHAAAAEQSAMKLRPSIDLRPPCDADGADGKGPAPLSGDVRREPLPPGAPEGLDAALAFAGADGTTLLGPAADLGSPPDFLHTDLVFVPDRFSGSAWGGPREAAYLHPAAGYFQFRPLHYGPAAGLGLDEGAAGEGGDYRPPLPVVADARDSLWVSVMQPAELCFAPITPTAGGGGGGPARPDLSG